MTRLGGLKRLISRASLLSWAEKIRPYAPQSLTLHNMMLLHGHGHASYADFYVLQGCPDAHAVLWEWTYASTSQNMGVYCREEEAETVTEALAAAPFFKWHNCLILHHVPEYLLSPLKGVAAEQGTKLNQSSYSAFSYVPHLDTKPLRVSPGFRLCRLGMAGLRRILETTDYERDMPLSVMTRLAQDVPYLGIYHDKKLTHSTPVNLNSLLVAGAEEIPVAWSISGFLGDTAKGYTIPEFRCQGFANLLSNAVARIQATCFSLTPHCFVDDDNNASLSMLASQAIMQRTHRAYWLFTSS